MTTSMRIKCAGITSSAIHRCSSNIKTASWIHRNMNRSSFLSRTFCTLHDKQKINSIGGQITPRSMVPLTSPNNSDRLVNNNNFVSWDILSRGKLMQNRRFSTFHEEMHDEATHNYEHSIDKKKTAPSASLKDRTNYFLKVVPIGEMTPVELVEARSLVHTWINKRTPSSTLNAEQLLERIFLERSEGMNRHAFMRAKIYNTVMNAFGKDGTYDGPLRAEALLNRMEDRYTFFTSRGGGTEEVEGEERHATEQIFDIAPQPDIVTYNTILNTWCHSTRPESVSKVEEIISQMQNNDNKPNPDSTSYNILLNTYANIVDEYGYAQKAEDVLFEMSQLSKDNGSKVSDNDNINNNHSHSIVTLSTMSFNTVLKAWKNSAGGIESAKRAEDILQLMLKLSSEGHDNIKPDSISFSTMMRAYGKHFCYKHDNSRNNAEEALKGAEALIDYLCHEDNSGSFQRHGASGPTFHALIECIATSDFPDAIDRVKYFLDKFVQAKRENLIADEPNAQILSSLISSFSKNRDKKTALKARAFLDDMLEDFVDDVDGDKSKIMPNTFCFNKVMHMHARFKEYHKVEELYQIMHEMDNDTCAPDIATFNIMMNMYLKNKNDKRSCEKALLLLGLLEDAHEGGNLKLKESFVYHAIINKLCKSADNPNNHPEAGRKALEILMRMEDLFLNGNLTGMKPDTIVYNMVLNALAKERSEDAAKKVMDIIDEMQSKSMNGETKISPDTLTYMAALSAWIHSGSSQRNKEIIKILDRLEAIEKGKDDTTGDVNGDNTDNHPQVQLDNGIFEVILRGLQHGKCSDDGKLAKQVLGRMVSISLKGHNTLIKPSALHCNLVIKAVCTSANKSSHKSVVDAHELLLKMIHNAKRDGTDFIPDRIGFNTLLSHWSKLRHGKTTDKAFELYSLMEELHREGKKNASPDRYTMSAMFNILSRSGRDDAVVKAQDLMDKCDVKDLDTTPYNTYLSVWARSSSNDKVKKVNETLKQMIEMNRADRISYNIALNTCAYFKGNSQDKKDALAVSMQIFNDLGNTSYGPDEISFQSAIQACRNLSESRSSMNDELKVIFEEYEHRGLQNESIIKELQRGLTESESELLFSLSPKAS